MAKLAATNDTHTRMHVATLMLAVITAIVAITTLGGCVQINAPSKDSTTAGNASNSQSNDNANSGQNNSPNGSGQGANAPSQQSGSGAGAGADAGAAAGAGANANSDTSSNSNNAAHIGIDRAKQIALDDAGVSSESATFIKEKLDYDDGREEYEIEFSVPYNDQSGQTRWRSQVYEYEIDAYSGQILSYDLDLE